MSLDVLELNPLTLNRVGFLDIEVPPELLGLAKEDVESAGVPAPWTKEVSGEQQIRIGASAWFTEAGGERVVFDPFQALDVLLRADTDAEQQNQTAIAELLEREGWSRESISRVVMSHIEGVGMVAWRTETGNWEPYFPNARIQISSAMMAAFESKERPESADPEYDAWRSLIDQGVVDTFEADEEILPGITAELQEGHGPGHSAFLLGKTTKAIFIGHLAVSPVHLKTGPCEALNGDAARCWQQLKDVLGRGMPLIGPLWPVPGYGQFTD